ncbi:MAG: ABC transporter substrate-binding protein [Cyanophyceae cyanobacterium]
MAKSPPPIVYIFLAIGLGFGGWYLYQSGQLPGIPTISLPFGGGGSSALLLSSGETLLFATPSNPNKTAAVELIQLERIDTAIPLLEVAVQSDRNDPETLIYLNNARAIQQGDPLVLAVVVPVSSNPDRAKETLRGVAYAQAQFRQQGGLAGRLLQILIVDDGDDPELAKTVAEGLVRRSNVLGVIGHNSSGATIAAAEVYQAAGLPMISSTSTSSAISSLGDAIFRVVPSDQIAGTQLARYALNTLQTRRAAILYNPNSAYSNSLRTAFSTTINTEGGVIITEVDLSSQGLNPASILQQVVNQQAEVIFMAPDNATAPQARELMRVNRSQPQPLALLGGDVLFSFATLQEGSSAQGLVVAIPWHPSIPANQGYAQAAERQWGGQVSWRTALGDDATRAFLTALTSNPSRAGIRAALSDPNFSLNSASGSLRFLPSGDRDAPNVLVKVEPGSRSGTGFDFVPALP